MWWNKTNNGIHKGWQFVTILVHLNKFWHGLISFVNQYYLATCSLKPMLNHIFPWQWLMWSNLWKIWQGFCGWVVGQIPKSWIDINIECNLLKICAWSLVGAKEDFHDHQCLIVIKATYSNLHRVEKDGVWVKVFVDGHPLGIQCSFFKMTMVTNYEYQKRFWWF